MKKTFKPVLIPLLLTAKLGMASFDTFIVEDIRYEGLSGLTVDTVSTYVPIQVGDALNNKDTAALIKTLYATNFFSNIVIARDGDTLVIKLIERPIIGELIIRGNRAIKTADLEKVLKALGFTEGQVYVPSIVARIEKGLLNEYVNLGRYNADIKAEVVTLDRNRVGLTLDIFEGQVAKIRDVKILGNEQFSEKELLKQLHLRSGGLFNFINHRNRFSRERFNADLETLRSYYMDRGYLNVEVLSTQVSLTPDRKDIYLLINIKEGEQYAFSGYSLSGNLIVAEEELTELVSIEPGETFSRKATIDTATSISDHLGDYGYLYANVEPVPEINEENKTVAINFAVNPGEQMYVRRITFSGNAKTADNVLRHNMEQMEGGVASLKHIREGIRALNLTGYIKHADSDIQQVEGTDNQVDLNYAIEEDRSAMFNIYFGYSTFEKFLFGVGFEQQNFLGTGKYINVNAQRSRLRTMLDFSYVNPQYTIDGISRGFDLFYSKTNFANIDLSDYKFDSYGGSVFYNVPVTLYANVNFSVGYERYEIQTSTGTADEVQGFVDSYGNTFDFPTVGAGWSKRTYDNALYPTSGSLLSVGANSGVSTSSSKVGYYRTNAGARWYKPLNRNRDFLFYTSANVGYGAGYGANSELPFFKNYFAGGIGSVRGYGPSTLGPRDSKGDPIGGNLVMAGTVALIVPHPFDTDSVRPSIFFDIGNVYNTKVGNVELNELRYSVGLGVEWRTPIGPLAFSIARPLNAKPGDNEQLFEFTIGTMF